jgi:hypothetical protein
MIDERFGYRSGDWSDEACGDSRTIAGGVGEVGSRDSG